MLENTAGSMLARWGKRSGFMSAVGVGRSARTVQRAPLGQQRPTQAKTLRTPRQKKSLDAAKNSTPYNISRIARGSGARAPQL